MIGKTRSVACGELDVPLNRSDFGFELFQFKESALPLNTPQRSFTLKERCGETLRDCQDSRPMRRIVGHASRGTQDSVE